MGISTNFILIFLLAALLAYISFLLWKPLKVSEPSSKLICFFLALAFSVFLGLVYLLGFTLGGTAFSLMMFGHTISYILAGICSVLLCAYTIKILPSKIGNGTAFHCFCNISFVVFLVLGIGEIATAHSSNFVLSTLPNAVFDNTVLGISNIGVALCAACIRPSKKVSPAVPEASPSPAQVSTSLFSGQENSERISFVRPSPSSWIISFRLTNPYPVISFQTSHAAHRP